MKKVWKHLLILCSAAVVLCGCIIAVMLVSTSRKAMELEKMLQVARFIGWEQDQAFYSEVLTFPDGALRLSMIEHPMGRNKRPTGSEVASSDLKRYLLRYGDKCRVEKRGNILTVSVLADELLYRAKFTIYEDGFSDLDLNSSASYLHAPAELREEIRQTPPFFQDQDQIQSLQAVLF
jgi:hypothetical protein